MREEYQPLWLERPCWVGAGGEGGGRAREEARSHRAAWRWEKEIGLYPECTEMSLQQILSREVM